MGGKVSDYLVRACVQDHDKLVALFKQHFSVQLESKDVSFRGWNWGSTDFQGFVLFFCSCYRDLIFDFLFFWPLQAKI